MPDPDDDRLAELDTVLAAYRVARTGVPARTEGGTLNANYRVPTANGPIFARLHRSTFTADRVRAEHAILRFVADHGIPAPVPLPTSSGETVVSAPTGAWSLYDWIEGDLPVRGELGLERAANLGDMHGRIHGALAEHPESSSATFAMTWDRDQSLDLLGRIAEAAAAQGAAPWVREGIALQAELLAKEPLRLPADFAGLPAQLAHGDYHDQQVLFDSAGGIVAVTDWELCAPFARIWDVVRSLAFSMLFTSPGLEEYLAAYRRHVQLTPDECRAGMQLWWQSRLGGVWVWAAYFLEGNERVSRFFAESVTALHQLADPAWRNETEDRIVRAATR